MNKNYFIYIMANNTNIVLYVGITNDLKVRVYEHKQKLLEGFTKKYNITKLVYYEIFDNPENAIKREKQLKGGSRKKKEELIMKFNPNWDDLYSTV